MSIPQEVEKELVLIIEDDPSISKLVKLYLGSQGYRTSVADRALLGTALWQTDRPDLVVLDLMLPDQSGLEVLQAMRAISQTPVIILTAKDAEHDKILGLELGADDYLTKPFSPGELVARIRAVLRRSMVGSEPDAARLVLGALELMPEERKVKVEGELVDLTPRQFELLHYLLLNRGIALSRERLLAEVWNYKSYGDAHTVDVHVGQLRRKLGAAGSLIQAVWGVGYRMEPTEPNDPNRAS